MAIWKLYKIKQIHHKAALEQCTYISLRQSQMVTSGNTSSINYLQQGLVNVFCKGTAVNFLGFEGHAVSVATLQLNCCAKAVIDNTTNGHSCVPRNSN